jgi:hypothetical protein
MKFAVFGSAMSATSENERLAEMLGAAIADSGGIVLAGGCGGLPHAAAKAALKKGTKTVGYSPGRDIKEHERFGMPLDGYSEFIFIPADFRFAGNKQISFKYRNVLTCAECDAGIIIGGRIGTLNEFTNLYDMGKVIGVLEGTGGTADMVRGIVSAVNKESGAVLVYQADPEKLIKEVIGELKMRKGDADG